ncbi:MAG: hypothetical protein F4Z28_01720, partial [Gammaproteobacteria bacterium]|nr:hypothetical protein [Gammaproteobacteria bacterium]
MKTAVLVLSAIAACLASAADSPNARDIELSPGTSELLQFPTDVGTAFIADPQVADVNVLDARNLFVLGRAPGITSLKVHDAAGQLLGVYAVRVNVEHEHVKTVVSKVVGDEGAVEVDAVGGALFVTGTVKSPSQAERLLRGINAVSDAPVVDALTLETLAQVNLEVLISEVSRNVTRELGIDWSLDMNPFFHPLRTWATGAGTRLGTGALQLARIYDAVVGFGPLEPGGRGNWVPPDNPDAEIARNEVDELGVEIPETRSADGGIVLSHAEIINRGEHRATAFLEALAQNGLVVVHARPTLTSVSVG